ncbi:MAG TPA: hypothetical protein VNU94_03695 [Acidobacteriaceae bacterium]|nr:hypothetical protein [Acidobacteriaceae bacterium]
MNLAKKVFVLGFAFALVFHSQLGAQTLASAPADASAPSSAQAPDDATRKISELVHAGKYAEAQQLTEGLLLVYPNDQRLIKAKALIDQLLSNAGPTNTNPANSQPAENAQVAQLTGMDKVDYNALIELARQAQESTDADQQKTLLNQFMDQSNTFLVRHPEQMLLWQIRAATAISLNEPMKGYEAGQKLLAAGAADSSDSNLQQLLAKLQLLGWLDSYKVQKLQFDVDEEQRQQAEAADHAKYTFPVGHANGMHYGFGHLTINKDGVVYAGSDETDRMNLGDIRELKAMCLSKGFCGMYFTPKSGRRYFFIVLTEEQVAAGTMNGVTPLPPAILGDAAVARWGFTGTSNSTLEPPPASADSKASK